MKTLIVKIGAVGDVVMALGMLDDLKREDPQVRITWVCGRGVETLLRSVPGIQELIVVDDARLLRGSFFSKMAVIVSLWVRLFGRSFDLIATGHSDRRYRLMSLTCFSARRRSFGRDRKRLGPIPGRYHGDEYSRLVTGTDGPGNGRARMPRLPIDLPKGLAQALPDPRKKTVALAPGGAKNLLRDDALRRWPLENYSVLADRLVEQGFTVLVTGGPGDDWVSDSFRKPGMVDLVGKTSLTDLLALYGKCDLLIAHDSGPLHLGVLADIPTLSLFGPTNPNEKVPTSEKHRVIWGGADLVCRPCYDGRDYAPCQENLCLKRVPVEKVLQEALGMLGEKAGVRAE